MQQNVVRNLIRPAAVPVGSLIAAAIIIITIGESLLRLGEPGKPELERLELWFGVLLSLAILGAAAFIATRPRTGGILEKEVAIGGRSMFDEPVELLSLDERNGPRGVIADIEPGYTLYAANGALAQVIGILPGGMEFGRRFQAYIYARGLFGATPNLWIPIEAVTAVFPRTRSVYLAVKGDETESFGWNRPPAHLSRTPEPQQIRGL